MGVSRAGPYLLCEYMSRFEIASPTARRHVRPHRLVTARAVVCVVAAMCVACSRAGDRLGEEGESVADAPAGQDSLARRVRVVSLASAREMDENSAAAASVAHPGVLFTINDSGNDAELFAFDTTGADRGRWRIEGAVNRDWEAIAVGRCAPADERWCVFIGDLGDNALRRPLVSIYRVTEPAPLAAGDGGVLRADALVARYPDGPHNVEAMVMAPNGALQLITKERGRRGRRIPAPPRVYELAAHAWGGATPAEAVLVDSLAIAPDWEGRYEVTDAALSTDGTVLAVRTPSRLFAFRVDSATARVVPDLPAATCELAQLRERQGEGVGILQTDSSTVRVALTSESRREPLRLVTCRLPPR